jgi:uncharacterized delta-60 repeat protein
MKRITIALALLLFASGLSYAQPQYLDKTFGDSGIVVSQMPLDGEYAVAVASLSDGRILQCGSTIDNEGYMVLRKFLSNGTIDTSFGNNGINVSWPIMSLNSAKIREYPDGRILIVGQFYNRSQWASHFPIPFAIRMLPNGKPDTSFCVGGVYLGDRDVLIENFYSALIQDDGTITIVGIRGDSLEMFPVITKLDASGERISSFGDNGRLVLDVPCDSVIIDDADINEYSGCVFGCYSRLQRTDDVYIIRTDINGELDSSFGDNGVVRLMLSDRDDQLAAVRVLPNKQVLCAVNLGRTLQSNLCVIKLTPNGMYDLSFGNWGGALYPENPNGYNIGDMLVDSNDNIVIAGWRGDLLASTFCLNSNGSYNANFGKNGEIETPIDVYGAYGAYGGNVSIAVQQDGKYVVAGWRYSADSYYSSTLQRIDPKRFASMHKVATMINPIFLHPTPSTDNCTVTYALPSSGQCTMTLRDESGREVRTFLVNEYRTTGEHKEELDLRGLVSGVYFLQIESGGVIQTAKLIKQ